MVYDELKLLQRLNHPHIVQFRDWFESRVRHISLLFPLAHPRVFVSFHEADFLWAG